MGCETQSHFVLFEDPKFIFSVFDAPDQREHLRLIRGNPPVQVLEGPVPVPIWFPKDPPITDATPKVMMFRVRIESMKENFGAYWEAVGDPEDGVQALEGWVLQHALMEKDEHGFR